MTEPRLIGADVLEIAVRMERAAAALYRRAAERLSDPSAAQLFRELARMEDAHEKRFLAMKADAQTWLPLHRKTRDEAERGRMYVKALMDVNVLQDAESARRTLAGDESVEDVFLLAMDMEKESVLFYTGLYDLALGEVAKSRIFDLIREEKKHLTLLSKAYGAFRKVLDEPDERPGK